MKRVWIFGIITVVVISLMLVPERYTKMVRVCVQAVCRHRNGVLTLPTVTVIERPLGIADQVQAVRGAVVHIGKQGVCQGSGCLISPDGILFSAKHVSDGQPGEYTVTLDDGKQYGVKYVLEDRENDVCFMQLDLKGHEPNLPFARLAQEDTMRVGDAVFIFGSPLGKENINTVSLGILSAVSRELYDREGWDEYKQYHWHSMIQTTSPAFPGNSGGPCFNMNGEVIGVLVAGQAETLNFSVPVFSFRETIDAVRQWFMLCRLEVIQPGKPLPKIQEEQFPYHSWGE